MPEIRNTFLAGKMQKDADLRLIGKGEYLHAENIRIANSEGSDVGEIEKNLSNEQMTSLSLGDNIKTISSLSDEFDEKLYWLVKSDDGCYLIENDVSTNDTVKVLEDERIGDLNILNFSETNLAEMILIVDSDNGNRILIITDNNSQPKCINIDRAKTYGLNGFNEEMILLIKKPPLYPPSLVLSDSGDQENNIEDKFLSFATRHKFLDGEYSAISPFSDIAFMPDDFNYNFSTGDNESMVNKFNSVAITFDTGSDLVTEIDIIFKESGHNNMYVIETVNKENKSLGDNVDTSINFLNNKIYKVLPEKELFRLYDNVPLLAKALTIINNRIVFGNYTENYDLTDIDGGVDFDVAVIKTSITAGIPSKSLKSNRDLELGVTYLDDYARMTTPQISDNNTVYIKNTDSLTQNQLQVTMKSKAPSFAKHFRFFIKQSKTDYEVVVPTLFYEDGAYRWVKLEFSDKDKIKENDILIVKTDSGGNVSELVEVKVLEVTSQERNFISGIVYDPSDSETFTEQSGLYFKIKPEGFRMNISDFQIQEFDNSHNSDHPKIIDNNTTVSIIEDAIYTGLDSTRDDMTSSGAFSGSSDQRYLIEIDGIPGTDTFQWSKDGGSTWESTGVAITGAEQDLDVATGVKITFGATTGHVVGDSWVVSAKIDFNGDFYFKAYGICPSIEGDKILAGARITIVYDEYSDGDDEDVFPTPFQASQNYANIEEWFWGDNIIASLSPLTIDRIWFRRGNTVARYLPTYVNPYMLFSQDITGVMTMFIESSATQNSDLDHRAKVRSYIEIIQIEETLVFETKPVNENSDIFYEIGKTYDIDVDGYHIGIGTDTNQSSGVDGVFLLDVFNCFTWGNGFESYQIKDLFNAKTMKVDTRPSTTIENYRRNVRISSLTYSNIYEQTTNYNALNEFNLGMDNFKDIDDKYGSIQKIISLNTNLEIWQEDKVHRVLYEKTVIYNTDGSSNIGKSDKVLNDAEAFAGEYGISKNPESLVIFGNYTYWTDAKRGMVLRKGKSGIEVISNFGMRDWFRDQFRDGDNVKILGGYDPYFGQYMININGYTLTFDEKVKGWTSFHSFLPDAIIRVNNRLFTVKDGDLYKHNSQNMGFNNFYGVQYTSNIKSIFNQVFQFDKTFKTIVQESLTAWDVKVSTNFTESSINKSEFEQRESKWFGYTRKNEDDSDMRGSTQGIGNIKSSAGLTITFGSISPSVSIGDILYQMNGNNREIIGEITKNLNNVITVDAIVKTPVAGRFSFSKKDSRIEGAEIKGYYMEVELKDDSKEKNTLFAVSTNITISNL